MCNAISNWAICYSTDVTLNATEVSVALEPLSVEQKRRQYSTSSLTLSPQYMTDCCIHTSDIARRQHLPGGR